MKNYLITILILIMSLNLNAQTEQTKKFIKLSSSLNYTSQTVDFLGNKTSTSVFLFDGYFGYFILDNFASTTSLTILGTSGSTTTSLAIGGRYYINKFYLGCDIDMINILDYTAIKLNAGYPIFINDKIAVEPSVVYSKISDATTSLSLMVGFAMYF